jgi:putative redox protein
MASVLLRSVGSRYVTQVTTEHHAFVADEPRPEGDDLGPDPYELLLGALGSCTSMTLLMYARRHGWSLEEVQIELTHGREHVSDRAGWDDQDSLMEVIHRRIHLAGALTGEQRARLLEIAQKCPVHRTLAAAPRVLDELA